MKWQNFRWEKVSLLDYDPEERQADYVVRTWDDNDVEYEGIGTYSCGELVEVEDIEIQN